MIQDLQRLREHLGVSEWPESHRAALTYELAPLLVKYSVDTDMPAGRFDSMMNGRFNGFLRDKIYGDSRLPSDLIDRKSSLDLTYEEECWIYTCENSLDLLYNKSEKELRAYAKNAKRGYWGIPDHLMDFADSLHSSAKLSHLVDEGLLEWGQEEFWEMKRRSEFCERVEAFNPHYGRLEHIISIRKGYPLEILELLFKGGLTEEKLDLISPRGVGGKLSYEDTERAVKLSEKIPVFGIESGIIDNYGGGFSYVPVQKETEEILSILNEWENLKPFPNTYLFIEDNQDVEITKDYARVGNKYYLPLEDYIFIGASEEQSVKLSIRSDVRVQLLNVRWRDSGESPVNIFSSCTVEFTGMCILKGGDCHPGIRISPGGHKIVLEGDGHLEVHGGSHSPSIGLSASRVEEEGWIVHHNRGTFKVHVEGLKIVTKKTPKLLGIGSHTVDGEVGVSVTASPSTDTSDIEGFGIKVDKVSIWSTDEEGNRVYYPLRVLSSDVVKHLLTISGKPSEEPDYNFPRQHLVDFCLTLGNKNLLRALDDNYVHGISYGKACLEKEHPLYSFLQELPNLGAEIREKEFELPEVKALLDRLKQHNLENESISLLGSD